MSRVNRMNKANIISISKTCGEREARETLQTLKQGIRKMPSALEGL